MSNNAEFPFAAARRITRKEVAAAEKAMQVQFSFEISPQDESIYPKFTQALKKGLGRAYLYVLNNSLADVVDLVLDACLHDQAYDRQSESSRAVWLFGMFADSPFHAQFREAILKALKTESETWTSLQLCELVKAMAIHEDMEAEQTLKEYVFNKASYPASDDWLGAEEWIDLKGLDGCIELARIYGQRLIADPNSWPNDDLFTRDKTGQDFKEAVIQLARQDDAIMAYLNFIDKQESQFRDLTPVDRETAKQSARNSFRSKYNLAKIINQAKAGANQFYGYYNFGRYATSTELEAIYDCLVNETNDAARFRFLWVFRQAPLPRLNDLFFNWATGSNEELQRSAIRALSQIDDPKVHDLARSKVNNYKLLDADSEALYLFLNNYDIGDEKLVMEALDAIAVFTDDDAHSLCSSIIDLVKRHKNVEWVDVLKWAYQKTPCTYCRHKIVILLDQLQALDQILLYECQYDANGDIRVLANSRLGVAG
jgi:hypothetical protein